MRDGPKGGAMENSPFIDDVPIKTSIYKGCSMAMLNNQRVFFLSKISEPSLAKSWNRLQVFDDGGATGCADAENFSLGQLTST